MLSKGQREKLQDFLLEAVRNLPIYPSPRYSDTTWIAEELARKHLKELLEFDLVSRRYVELPSDKPQWYWVDCYVHNFVLRELNRLHGMGKIDKKISYGGKGQGRNYTFIRWGKHARRY